MANEKPLRVRVSYVVELDSDAMEAYELSFGVTGRRAIADDIRNFLSNDPLPISLASMGVQVVR